MARARNIKPELFMDDVLGACSDYSRLFFIGLLVFSSKEGFITLSKSELKEEIYPYRQDVDVDFIFNELEESKLIERHEFGYLITDIHKWCVESKAIDTSYYASNRRALKRQSIPSWADKKAIKEIYKQSKRLSINGIKHHVDHVIPLKNSLVCGLHVESNLMIITAAENLKKSNKFNGDKNA